MGAVNGALLDWPKPIDYQSAYRHKSRFSLWIELRIVRRAIALGRLEGVAAVNTNSPIECLLAWRRNGWFPDPDSFWRDIAGAQFQLCQELCYRYTRRFPNTLLRCDSVSFAVFEWRTGCEWRGHAPRGVGLLKAMPPGSLQRFSNDDLDDGITSWAAHERRKLTNRKSFHKMSTDLRRCAVLAAELKGVIRAKTWIR